MVNGRVTDLLRNFETLYIELTARILRDMKIFLAQQNYHIGNFEENARKIIEGINKAKEAGADLVVFSELCICGYPPRDFLEFNDFINQSYEAIDVVKQHADTIGVLLGGPSRNPRKEG